MLCSHEKNETACVRLLVKQVSSSTPEYTLYLRDKNESSGNSAATSGLRYVQAVDIPGTSLASLWIQASTRERLVFVAEVGSRAPSELKYGHPPLVYCPGTHKFGVYCSKLSGSYPLVCTKHFFSKLPTHGRTLVTSVLNQGLSVPHVLYNHNTFCGCWGF
eukprot:2467280-Pyramimonas_sp.AAC.1